MSRELLCYCFKIYKHELVDIIRRKNAKTVADVQKYCRAGMGCGGCRLDIQELLEEWGQENEQVELSLFSSLRERLTGKSR